ncbi:putative elongation factor 1-gamma (EF-1-gamma) [Trypanosoma cruzi]|nr:putative elongation factor 1-gamma (EF-1-gamma) [Trypanosoma cruzi]
MDACGTLSAFCWWLAAAAARCPPCVKVLPALGVILLTSLFLLCQVRALLGVCWRVTDGATMASSDGDSRCALGTHPRTLPCLSVGVIAARHCCERDGDHDGVTPREGPAHCRLWRGEAVCLQPDRQNRTVFSLRSLRRHHPLWWCPQEPPPR